MNSRRLFLALATLIATSTCAAASAADLPKVAGKPNLNGIWEAMNTANWNIEAHSAQKVASQWQLGALFAIPGGKSVVAGGKIPYLPQALKTRDEARAQWPKSDPETFCY